MTSQPLFATRQRTDDSLARHDETWIDFLDRVDDVVFERIRVLLNEWFVEFAPDKAVRLREDFFSGTPRKATFSCLAMISKSRLAGGSSVRRLETAVRAGSMKTARTSGKGKTR
jgi:hypothetical protein